MTRSPKSYNLDEELQDEIIDLKARREQRERGSVSESDIANEALTLGLAALELYEERAPDLDDRAREAIVKQQVLDELRAMDD